MNEEEELHPHDGSTGHFSAKIPSAAGRIADFEVGADGAAASLVITSLNDDQYELVDTEFETGLTAAQADEFLASGFDAVRLHIMLSLEDERMENAIGFAVDHAELVGVDYDELSQIDQGQVLAAVFDREQTDLLYQAVLNTGPYLMRVPLAPDMRAEAHRADPNGSLIEFDRDNLGAQRTARTTVINRILGEHGVATGHGDVRRAVAALVAEGPADWHEEVALYVLWCGSVEGAAAVNWESETAAGRRLSFPGAHVILFDVRSGHASGQMIRGPINVVVTSDSPAVTDSPLNGASGLAIASNGNVRTAYKRGDPTSEWIAIPQSDAGHDV